MTIDYLQIKLAEAEERIKLMQRYNAELKAEKYSLSKALASARELNNEIMRLNSLKITPPPFPFQWEKTK